MHELLTAHSDLLKHCGKWQVRASNWEPQGACSLTRLATKCQTANRKWTNHERSAICNGKSANTISDAHTHHTQIYQVCNRTIRMHWCTYVYVDSVCTAKQNMHRSSYEQAHAHIHMKAHRRLDVLTSTPANILAYMHEFVRWKRHDHVPIGFSISTMWAITDKRMHWYIYIYIYI